MSTVSADECYSNVDNLEELRRICSERDATISKLKLLLVRKNKTISSLEEEISHFKSGNQYKDESSTKTIDEIAKLNDIVMRQQVDLEKSKKELATLSKMNSDIQKNLTAVKQERDTFKSELSRLTSDLVTANARTTELFAVASQFSKPPAKSHVHSQNQHAFILSIFKNLVEGHGVSVPDASIVRVLQSIHHEINRSLGIDITVDGKIAVDTWKDICPYLEKIASSLKQFSSLHAKEVLKKIRSSLTDISSECDNVRLFVKDLSMTFISTSQSILSTVDKLNSMSHGVIPSPILQELSQLKSDLVHMKSVVTINKSALAENTSVINGQITSLLQKKMMTNQPDRFPNSDALLAIFSELPCLQKDVCEVRTSASQWFTSLQSQIYDIQRLHDKLLLEINLRQQPPPPYSERPPTMPDASVLEALLADIWQLKDSLSGVKSSLTDYSVYFRKNLQEIEHLRGKLLYRLHGQAAQLRDDLTDVRNDVNSFMLAFKERLAALSTLVSSINEVKLKNLEDTQRQRFKDYDRLVRDKEAEINQLRETCDRLSDDCDRFAAMREALRHLLDASTTTSLIGLNSEDASLITSLNNRLNHSQAARLELVEQTQAITALQSDLATKSAALEVALTRASEAETEAAGLQEKLNRAKQLLVRARKDATEAEQRARLLEETEAKVRDLTEALDQSQRHGAALETTKAETEAKLAAVFEEKERLIVRVASLQKQFESYKIKVSH